MDPDPVPAGIIAFGLNAPSVDAACACLMGYDPDLIPIVRQAFRCKDYPLAEWTWGEAQVVSNNGQWRGPLHSLSRDATFHFQPHFGWTAHIERLGSPSSREPSFEPVEPIQ
jgi:hypothetical protein